MREFPRLELRLCRSVIPSAGDDSLWSPPNGVPVYIYECSSAKANPAMQRWSIDSLASDGTIRLGLNNDKCIHLELTFGSCSHFPTRFYGNP